MSTVTYSYSLLANRLRDIDALEGISGLLGWDEMVMLPTGSSDSRGKQKEALAGVIYDKKTDPVLGELLKELHESCAGLNEVEQVNVELAYKNYIRATALPKDLSQRIAALETEGYHAWIAARGASDYSKFAPVLQEWVDISRRKAALIDPSQETYNVLLDEFEKGMTATRIDEIFGQLRVGLVPLIANIKSKGTAPDGSLLRGKEFDTKAQAALCEVIALDLGFDITKGRLDVSVHPFTGGTGPTDVRMTTRFKAMDVTEGLTGAIHETGHSLYEQGRNVYPDWEGLPVSKALSMGVHESQSLLWERMVALSKPFSHYLLPKLQTSFPDLVPTSTTPEALYGAMNLVLFPSLIRVESDEVTYGMHVVLRYEIERGLVEGKIKVEDVPAIWNAKMKEYLQTDVEALGGDAKGVLQDVHWSAGAIGYFPTYTLGAMMAAQIFQAAEAALPNLSESIAKGEFAPLKTWLNENLHCKGSFYRNADELMTAVTGRVLDPNIYLSYLNNKYTDLYKL